MTIEGMNAAVRCTDAADWKAGEMDDSKGFVLGVSQKLRIYGSFHVFFCLESENQALYWQQKR